MPYHNKIFVKNVSRTQSDARTISTSYGGIVDIPSYHYDRPEQEFEAAAETRTGSNSSSKLQRFVHSRPKLKIRKKIVGYEFYYTKKSFNIFTRGGKRITKTIKRPGYKPIYIRYLEGSVPTSRDILAAKNQPLFPNRLDYRKTTSTLIPESFKTEFAFNYWGDGHNFHSGTATLRGPGQHHIDSIGTLVQAGTVVSLSALEAPGSSLESEALYRLYKKVGSSAPSLMTAIGESPELVRTIGTILEEGFKLAHAIYRLNTKYIAKKVASTLDAKAVSQLWLSWVYGIAPALNDAQSTLKAMADSERVWRVYSTKSKEILQPSEAGSPGDVTDYFYGQWLREIRNDTVFGVLLLGKLNFEKYIDTRVLRIDALGSTAYELIPFSFMLDWFIDIGGYLASARVLSDQQYHAWRTRTQSTKDYWNGYFGPSHYTPNMTMHSPPFRAMRDSFVCTRELITLPEMPMPTLARTDGLFDMTTFRRSLNALAIAITRG